MDRFNCESKRTTVNVPSITARVQKEGVAPSAFIKNKNIDLKDRWKIQMTQTLSKHIDDDNEGNESKFLYIKISYHLYWWYHVECSRMYKLVLIKKIKIT